MKTKFLNVTGLLAVGALMVFSMTGCGEKAKTEPAAETTVSEPAAETTVSESAAETEAAAEEGVFSSFEGKDLDGNDVDQSIIQKNKVTVLNFWFNGCSACVSEMPELEKFNGKLKEKGAELIGVNADAAFGDAGVKEAKEILQKQGATYTNIYLTGKDKAADFMGEIMAFPTTVLVDQKGNIIGEPICGTIDNEKTMNEILAVIDQVTADK